MYISEIAVTEYRGRLVSLYPASYCNRVLGAYRPMSIGYFSRVVSPETTDFDNEVDELDICR